MLIQVRLYIVLILVSCMWLSAAAQETDLSIDMINNKIDHIQSLANKNLWQQCFDEAMEVQEIAESKAYAQGKGKCLALKAKASFGLKNYQTGLKNYLYAEMVFLPLNASVDLASIYAELGKYYSDQGIYSLASQYYSKSENLFPQRSNREAMAYCYQMSDKAEEAIKIYNHIINNEIDINPKETIAIQRKLVELNLQINKPKSALSIALDLEKNLTTDDSDAKGLFDLYNTIGYIYKDIKQNNNATNYFEKALQLIGKAVTTPIDERQEANLYINLGTINSSSNEFSKAKEYFQKALSIFSKLNDKREIASTNNFVAANYYLSGSNAQAIKFANQAEALGLQLNDYSILATTYMILSKVNQAEKFTEKAEGYTAQSLKAKAKMIEAEKNRMQQMSAIEQTALLKEKELKNANLSSEEEKRKLKDYKIESEKKAKALELKAKELELNQSELNNQRLEKERISQLLALSNQRQKMDELQKEKEIQQLLITQKEGNEKQRVQEISLLEKEKKIQQQKLQEAKKFRKLGIVIFVLVGAILITVVLSLLFSLRAKRKVQQQNLQIAEQSKELQSTNNELHQRQEEILSQNNLLEETNKKLHSQNHIITSSISAASIIQGAVLPTTEKLRQFFSDYFILFRPRDIVSGDFYWIEEMKGQLFIIAADCTGHGVPGAFMSMIGKTLLDKIILVKQIYEPAKILTALHKEVTLALHQDTTGNNDGMDVAIVRLQKGENENEVELSYCGAKSPVGFKNLKTGEFTSLKESRKSIGGKTSNHLVFEERTAQLADDTMLFLYSDGFIDQNDQERRRFGSDAFRELLNEIADLPCRQQETKMIDILEKQLKETTQRDDILVLGLKISPKNFTKEQVNC